MKLLHTSDWHLGKSLYDISLLEDQELVLGEILALLERERVDAVLLAGDIYDRPVPSVHAVQLYDHFLARAAGALGIPVLAVAGNHDSGTRLEFGSALYRSSGYHISGHPRPRPDTILLRDKHGPVEVLLLPYLHPADARSLLEDPGIRSFDGAYRALLSRYEPAADRRVAVAHGFFSRLTATGERMELLTSDSEVSAGGIDIAGADCFAAFHYVALGHLHAPQWVDKGRIRYSGTPLKYSLSEENQVKSCTLVTLGAEGVEEVKAVPLPARRNVRTVRGPFGELMDPASHRDKDFGDYVFAEIDGTEVPYPMEKLRALFPNLLGLRFQASASRAPTLRAVESGSPRLSTEELFRRFYREARGEEIPSGQLELVRGALAELEGEEALF